MFRDKADVSLHSTRVLPSSFADLDLPAFVPLHTLLTVTPFPSAWGSWLACQELAGIPSHRDGFCPNTEPLLSLFGGAGVLWDFVLHYDHTVCRDAWVPLLGVLLRLRTCYLPFSRFVVNVC